MSPSSDITVVIPVRNGAAHIAETLKSLAAVQGHVPRVIVVDGASTDATLAIVATFGDLVTRVVSEPDHGQADAIAKGFALARTPFVTWLCADDRVMPDAYARGLAILAGDDRCALTFGDILVHGEHGEPLAVSHFPQAFTPDALLAHCSVSQPGSLYRRHAIEAVGGIRQDLHYVMDFDLYLRLHLAGYSSRHIGGLAAAFRLSPHTKSGRAALAFVRESVRVLSETGPRGRPGARHARRVGRRLRAVRLLRALGAGRLAWWITAQALPMCFPDTLRGRALGLCVQRHFGGLRAGPRVRLEAADRIVLGYNVAVAPGARLTGPATIPMDTIVTP